jgi:hypothetical protein
MKALNSSLLALSCLAGGILAASAGNPVTYMAYNSYMRYTNVESRYWSASGGPTTFPTTTFPRLEYQGGSIYTDGAGKITGYASWYIYYDATGSPWSRIEGTVSGKLAGKSGSPTTVTMTIKGSGFTTAGAGLAEPLKVNLSFKGQVANRPDTANVLSLVGALTGTLQGTTPAGSKNYKLPSGRVAYIGASDYDTVHIDMDIIQSSNGKMQVIPWSSSPDRTSMVEGKGSIKKDGTSYQLSLKGVGFSKGVSLRLSGNVGFYTNTVTSGTNVTVVTFPAPTTAELGKNSKVNGQAVQGLVPQYIRASLER